MTPPFITLRRIPYEEPYHLCLVISASNGEYSGSLEYYCNAKDVAEVGNRLAAFPEMVGDDYTYELGSPRPEDRFAHHLILRVFTVDSAGHSALQIVMNNNRKPPDDCSCSFTIPAEVSAINRLGRLFKTFGELKHEMLRWSTTKGGLSDC